MTTPKTLTTFACLLTAGLILSGCAASHDQHAAPPAQSATAAPSSAATGATDHNDHDVMFAQMMIPHHQQAIQMSDMLLAKPGVRDDVRHLAEQIKGAQQPEIDTMKGWLTQWNQPVENDHSGHDMGGMLTKQQLEDIAKADGPRAQKLYLEGMIGHHEGAVRMAQGGQRMGRSDALKRMCDDIVRSQNDEIKTMKGMLASM